MAKKETKPVVDGKSKYNLNIDLAETKAKSQASRNTPPSRFGFRSGIEISPGFVLKSCFTLVSQTPRTSPMRKAGPKRNKDVSWGTSATCVSS